MRRMFLALLGVGGLGLVVGCEHWAGYNDCAPPRPTCIYPCHCGAEGTVGTTSLLPAEPIPEMPREKKPGSGEPLPLQKLE